MERSTWAEGGTVPCICWSAKVCRLGTGSLYWPVLVVLALSVLAALPAALGTARLPAAAALREE
ncbi:MAG: hypothetical protein ACOY93_22325, partial [Bacillota bacterium]